MQREYGRLTAKKAENAKPKSGKQWAVMPDGGCLYLQVTTNKHGEINRSWLFKYQLDGQRREMGLGSLKDRSLAEARTKARELRQQLLDGTDPLLAKQQAREERRAALAEQAKRITFRECAEGYVASHADGWRSAKHTRQWLSSVADHAFPILGNLAVSDITTAHVVKVLEPIWTAIPETASRVRNRIERILDWAKVREYRDGENPARWRGHLAELFPAKGKVRKVKHHAAMVYTDVPAFMAALREREALAAAALEFAILTAGRTSEVIQARWDEIDVGAKLWTVPAGRMKAGREHRVPLSDAALRVLERMRQVRHNDHVFPGERSAALSNMTFLRLLRRMDRDDLTMHGFRSSFRTWAAERTSYPREIAEAALAHVVGDATEQAYQRGDMFDKRRKLMDAWATYCTKPARTGGVFDLKAKVSA